MDYQLEEIQMENVGSLSFRLDLNEKQFAALCRAVATAAAKAEKLDNDMDFATRAKALLVVLSEAEVTVKVTVA